MSRLQLASLLLVTALCSAAHGQIFFNQGTTIEEYSLSGTPINTHLITNSQFNGSMRLAVDGDDLFVLNNSMVSEYTTQGELLKKNLFNGITVGAIAASGNDLFLSVFSGHTSPDEIEESTTAGTIVNPLLSTANSHVENMTISGDNVFTESVTGTVVAPQQGFPQWIGEFSSSGGAPNPNFITTMGTNCYGVAVIGNDIFTSNFTTRTIWEFSTSGSLLNDSFITPPDLGPLAIASGGDDLFISTDNNFGLIAEYDSTGAPVDTNFIPDLTDEVTTIAVEVPEPDAVSFLALAGTALLFRRPGSRQCC